MPCWLLVVCCYSKNSQTCNSSWARMSWSACLADSTRTRWWMSSSCMRAFLITCRIWPSWACGRLHCKLVHMALVGLHLKHRTNCRARLGRSVTTVSGWFSLLHERHMNGQPLTCDDMNYVTTDHCQLVKHHNDGAYASLTCMPCCFAQA